MDLTSQLITVLQTVTAMLLGGLIGMEREMADKPAGFRTHMMAAGASALLIKLGKVLIVNFDGELISESLSADPVRIIHAIVIGVSFLGAGTIIRRKPAEIEGLTTAASILMASAVGISVGVNLLAVAVSISVITFTALYGLSFIERRLLRRRGEEGEDES